MIQIEESNPSFESCSDCIHSDDSEEICILRRCIHAVAQLNECYVPKQPTIEPERNKGRWIKKTIKKKIENDYSCSECGRHVSVMRGYDVRLVYPFCHCGADMTEGEG